MRLAHKDHKGQPEQAQLEHQDLLVLLDHKDHKDLLVQPVHPVYVEQLD